MSGETSGAGIDRARDYLQAYFDGQLGDEALTREIEQRLQTDAALRREFEELGALRDRLQAQPQAEAPAYLRNRIKSAMREAVPARQRKTSMRTWGWGVGWAVAACLVIVLSTAPWKSLRLSDAPGADNGLRMLVEEHVAVLQSDQADIQTDDAGALEQWFRERLDFAPSVPQWSWARTVGGKVSFVGGRRVAQVQYSFGDSELSLFVQPPMEPGKM